MLSTIVTKALLRKVIAQLSMASAGAIGLWLMTDFPAVWRAVCTVPA